MEVRYHNLVDGAWFSSASGSTFRDYNPANGYEIGVFPRSNKEDVDKALEAARRAFPAWRSLGMVKRAELLWKVARVLEDEVEEQKYIVTQDSGKQINEAYADVIEAFHMIQYAFAYGHRGKHEQGGLFDDEIATKFCFVREEPRGVVAAITPWNFPWAIPMWLTTLSLVTGNVVILKPSEETPLCGHHIARIFYEAGVPPGVFQVLHGIGEEVGWELVKDPRVNTVLFTGSFEVGSKIKQETARHFDKNCTVETGSKSGVIVLADADLDMAVTAALASAFKTSGQRCVSGGRIIVERPVYDQFVEKFVAGAKKIKTGDPLASGTFYGPMINKAGVLKGKQFNQRARDEGFEILVDRTNEEPPIPGGNWLQPFVYTGEWRSDSRCFHEEAFAPHVAIIPADDASDALAIYNDTDYGLAGSVFTNNFHQALKGILEMDCGIAYHNLPCIGAGVRMPFGGIKKSGGLTPSAAGLLPAITHLKSVTLNLAEEIVMAQGLNINT